jgi:hypothetical protein
MFSAPLSSCGDSVWNCFSGLVDLDESRACACFVGVLIALGVRSPNTRRLGVLEGLLLVVDTLVLGVVIALILIFTQENALGWKSRMDAELRGVMTVGGGDKEL